MLYFEKDIDIESKTSPISKFLFWNSKYGKFSACITENKLVRDKFEA